MYILYVDELGDPQNANEEHFVLAGMAVFERQIHWLSQQIDALEIELFGALPAPDEVAAFPRPVEFHAAAMQSRREPPWDSLTTERSRSTLQRMAQLIVDSHESCALFGVVVHRPSLADSDPVVLVFSELTSRFDLFLSRLHARGDTQRGLMVFDESRHERRLQTLLRAYNVEGGPFGRLKNLADVPFFADSRASRMLQLADFVAWATFRRYERGTAELFDRIVGRFDADGHRIHGLHHRTLAFRNCFCPACFSRRAAG